MEKLAKVTYYGFTIQVGWKLKLSRKEREFAAIMLARCEGVADHGI